MGRKPFDSIPLCTSGVHLFTGYHFFQGSLFWLSQWYIPPTPSPPPCSLLSLPISLFVPLVLLFFLISLLRFFSSIFLTPRLPPLPLTISLLVFLLLLLFSLSHFSSSSSSSSTPYLTSRPRPPLFPISFFVVFVVVALFFFFFFFFFFLHLII